MAFVELVSQLPEGVAKMHESTTYQAILREGRKEGLIEGREEGLIEGREEGLIEGRIAGEQHFLLRQGTKKFGKPDSATLAALEAIRDIERLEALGERIIDPAVNDWDNLLGSS
jgi:predicted transposase YdaD